MTKAETTDTEQVPVDSLTITFLQEMGAASVSDDIAHSLAAIAKYQDAIRAEEREACKRIVTTLPDNASAYSREFAQAMAKRIDNLGSHARGVADTYDPFGVFARVVHRDVNPPNIVVADIRRFDFDDRTVTFRFDVEGGVSAVLNGDPVRGRVGKESLAKPLPTLVRGEPHLMSKPAESKGKAP